jgi:hypothetical protein
MPRPAASRMLMPLVFAGFTFAAAVPGALAQTDDPSDPPPGFLAGPDVGEKTTEPTLVARTLDGEVQKLPAPPAIAVLELLEIDEKTREKIDELLAERAALLDTLVLSNIELLTQVETVMAVGEPVEKLNMLREGLTALEPVRKWGRLDRRISAVLPRDLRAQFREHIDEYERERYRTARETGEFDNRFGYKMMRYWEDIAWEIERAAERVFDDDDDGSAWLRTLSAKLELTPDQQGEIQAMAERFYIDTKGRPSKQDEFRFIAKIRTVMTIEQRWKFTGMLLRGELEPENDAMLDE